MRQRLQSLAMALICGVFGGLMVWGVGAEAYRDWQLVTKGRHAKATVEHSFTQTHRTSGKKKLTFTWHRHRLKIEGRRFPLSTTLPQRYSRGQTLDVIYLPDKPSTLSVGTPEDNVLDLMVRNLGWAWLLVGSIVGGLMALSTPFWLLDVVLGKAMPGKAEQEQIEL